MLDNAPRTTAASRGPLDLNISRLRARPRVDATGHKVEVYPPDVVQRRAATWGGIAAETVQATRRQKIDVYFCAPLHLLAVCDRGMRSDGDTFVEGLPRSRLRDVRRKLTFVPAGHEYHEWQEPRVLMRGAYFYFDPATMPMHAGSATTPATLAPRLFFEDATLIHTALKIMRLIEQAGPVAGSYFGALATVLTHELVRLDAGAEPIETHTRGGLATWQQRAVAGYIEDHLVEQIPLAVLAQLARLSPHYFCRAFKQSFGMPPHRYHNSRRIEHAKTLLTKPKSSVTSVGAAVG